MKQSPQNDLVVSTWEGLLVSIAAEPPFPKSPEKRKVCLSPQQTCHTAGRVQAERWAHRCSPCCWPRSGLSTVLPPFPSPSLRGLCLPLVFQTCFAGVGREPNDKASSCRAICFAEISAVGKSEYLSLSSPWSPVSPVISMVVPL